MTGLNRQCDVIGKWLLSFEIVPLEVDGVWFYRFEFL
jgi:hypothetical protein